MKQRMKQLGKKKKLLLLLGCILIVVLAVVLILFNRKKPEEDTYSYEEVDENAWTPNYYTGVVEAQQTLEVQRDSSKDIDEVYVHVGDEVTVGQSLFSYKTDDTELELEQAKIELQSLGTDISDYNNQITNLTNEMNAADDSLKPDYQMQINELNTSLKQAQLSQKTKQAQIDSLQSAIDQATVTSTIDGVVKSIASTSSTDGAYMTILATGTYQVKGTIDEMNVASISEGQTVTIHSRVDDSTWSGTITKVDTEDKADTSTNSMYADASEGMESATKYYFYIALDDATGLLLGQHVYVEPTYEDMEMDTEDASAESAGTDTEDAGAESAGTDTEDAGIEAEDTTSEEVTAE